MNRSNFSRKLDFDLLSKFGWDGPAGKDDGLSPEQCALVLSMWSNPRRVYHGIDHLFNILEQIDSEFSMDKNPIEYKVMVLAAIMHDAVYVPGATDNEERSIELYRNFCIKPSQEVIEIIEATKYHSGTVFKDPLIRKFLRYDLGALCSDNIAEMVAVEDLIFREFQFVDYKLYRQGREKVLRNLRDLILDLEPTSLIDQYINYIHTKKRRIAIYPGSFYPMHKGHLNILEKAGQMFDKVILAPGINPDKDQDGKKQDYIKGLSKKLPNQIETFTGFLTDYVKSKMDQYTDFVVVKGIGRPGDLENEKTQQRYLEDIWGDIKITYIVPDREFEHYSSSAIRQIDAIESKAMTGADYSSKYKI